MDFVTAFTEHGLILALIGFCASILGGVISSLVTSWITYRHERYMENRKKALEVYDECLELLGSFRRRPSLALDDQFYIELMGIGSKVKAYGSRNVSDAMQVFLESLEKHLYQYQNQIDKIEALYWLPEHEEVDSSTGEAQVVSGGPRIDPDQYEALEEDARATSTPTQGMAKKYAAPVVNAISKSLRPLLSKKGF